MIRTTLTDSALSAAYSPEADKLRISSKRWFIASQILMLLAATPLLLTFLGIALSLFGGSFDTFFTGAAISIFGGVAGTFIAMLIFCPFALICFYKFYSTRRKIMALVEDSIRSTRAEQDSAHQSTTR